MRALIVFARPLVLLLTVMLSILSACGSSESAAPTTTVTGPAVIFFYTDN